MDLDPGRSCMILTDVNQPAESPTLIWIMIICLLVLIAFSGFFSACETAFTSVNEARLKSMSQKKYSAQKVLRLYDSYDQVISTLLIGNNLVNIAASTIGVTVFTFFCGGVNGPWVSTLVLTVVILIFGEITPKLIAKEFPEKYLTFMIYPILFIYYILWPFAKIFDGWKWLLTKIFKFDKNAPTYTEEEFKMVVSDIKDEGVINQTEHDLIKKSLQFDDSLVSQVMQPLSKLVYITDTMSLEEMKEIYLINNYSRVPYIDAESGKVLGIMLQRDFYEMLIQGKDDVGEILNPCMFVKSNVKVSVLFNRMKKEKQMMALVLDDKKHLMGVITMEDCLEELVGEIDDEQDAEDDEAGMSDDYPVLSPSVYVDGLPKKLKSEQQVDLINNIQIEEARADDEDEALEAQDKSDEPELSDKEKLDQAMDKIIDQSENNENGGF